MTQHLPSRLAIPDLRRDWLADRLGRGATLSIADLARETGVSVDTIRRDLAALEAAGRARRVRGGAVPATPAAPLRERAAPLPEGLVRRAAAALGGARTLILDGGTTVAALARVLEPLPDRLIVTPSPHVAAITHGRGIATIVVGGPVSGRGGIATGAEAQAAIAAHFADIAILGACGLDAAAGLSSDDHAESGVKRAMAGAAARTMVLAGAAKLGRRARHLTLPPEEIDTLLTDAEAGATAPFAALGIALP